MIYIIYTVEIDIDNIYRSIYKNKNINKKILYRSNKGVFIAIYSSTPLKIEVD